LAGFTADMENPEKFVSLFTAATENATVLIGLTAAMENANTGRLARMAGKKGGLLTLFAAATERAEVKHLIK